MNSLGRSATGILVCKSGIYFIKKFVNLYFLWYIFRNTPITLISYELEIGKGNRFHIRGYGMPRKEILLFLKKLQQKINMVYDEGTDQLNAWLLFLRYKYKKRYVHIVLLKAKKIIKTP